MSLVKFIKTCHNMRENKKSRVVFSDQVQWNHSPFYEVISKGKMIECGNFVQATDAFNSVRGETKIVRIDVSSHNATRTIVAQKTHRNAEFQQQG